LEPNGPSTIAGVDKLLQEMYRPKTPETAAETEMKKTFLESARRQVSGEGLIPGAGKGREGQEIFHRLPALHWPAVSLAPPYSLHAT
jgi:hypothetical protein